MERIARTAGFCLCPLRSGLRTQGPAERQFRNWQPFSEDYGLRISGGRTAPLNPPLPSNAYGALRLDEEGSRKAMTTMARVRAGPEAPAPARDSVDGGRARG